METKEITSAYDIDQWKEFKMSKEVGKLRYVSSQQVSLEDSQSSQSQSDKSREASPIQKPKGLSPQHMVEISDTFSPPRPCRWNQRKYHPKSMERSIEHVRSNEMKPEDEDEIRSIDLSLNKMRKLKRENLRQSPKVEVSHFQKKFEELDELSNGIETFKANKDDQLASHLRLKFEEEKKHRSHEMNNGIDQLMTEILARQQAVLEHEKAAGRLYGELDRKTAEIKEFEEKCRSELNKMIVERQQLEDKLHNFEHIKHSIRESTNHILDEIETISMSLKQKTRSIEESKKHLHDMESKRIHCELQLQNIRGNLFFYCRTELSSRDSLPQSKTFKVKDANLHLLNANRKQKVYSFDKIFKKDSELFDEMQGHIKMQKDKTGLAIISSGGLREQRRNWILSQDTDEKRRGLALSIIDSALDSIRWKVDTQVRVACLQVERDMIYDMVANSQICQDNGIECKKGIVVLKGLNELPVATIHDACGALKLISANIQAKKGKLDEEIPSYKPRPHLIIRVTTNSKKSGEQLWLANLIDIDWVCERRESTGSRPNDRHREQMRSPFLEDSSLISPVSPSFKTPTNQQTLLGELRTLYRVIMLLKHQKKTGLKEVCLPMRESSLTQLTQDCFGSQAETIMLLTISPSIETEEEEKNQVAALEAMAFV